MASSEDYETLWSTPIGPNDRIKHAKRKTDGLEVTLRVVDISQCLQQRTVLDSPYFKNPHPGIAQIFETFEEGTLLYIVMEACQNGDLAEFIECHSAGAPLEVARQYTAELINIYEALQEAQLVHRDVKPSSFLRTKDGHLKLAMNPYDKAPTPVPEYASPERLKNEEVTVASDVWGFACVIYELFAGKPIFKGDTHESTIANILTGTVQFPDSMPQLTQYFLEKMLRLDPGLRLKDVDRLKSDIFFHGLDFTRLRAEQVPEPAPVKSAEPEVLMSGIVKKKAGWIYKKRLLLISDQPRIAYYEPTREEHRGDIPMSPEVKAEVKGRTTFHIITPKRTYYFKDLAATPESWVSAVQTMLAKAYNQQVF